MSTFEVEVSSISNPTLHCVAATSTGPGRTHMFRIFLHAAAADRCPRSVDVRMSHFLNGTLQACFQKQPKACIDAAAPLIVLRR